MEITVQEVAFMNYRSEVSYQRKDTSFDIAILEKFSFVKHKSSNILTKRSQQQERSQQEDLQEYDELSTILESVETEKSIAIFIGVLRAGPSN